MRQVDTSNIIKAICSKQRRSASSIYFAEPGSAITLRQPHRKFGTCYAEFIGHVGDGKHILVSKLISGMWSSRWTKPMRVPFADVVAVHDNRARPEAA